MEKPSHFSSRRTYKSFRHRRRQRSNHSFKQLPGRCDNSITRPAFDFNSVRINMVHQRYKTQEVYGRFRGLQTATGSGQIMINKYNSYGQYRSISAPITVTLTKLEGRFATTRDTSCPQRSKLPGLSAYRRPTRLRIACCRGL